MSVQFTDDDLEKVVEDANGERIGTVAAVEGDVAQVEPGAGIVDSLRAALGWTRTRDTVSIRSDAVEEITDRAIRLETESLAVDEAEGPEVDDSGSTEPGAAGSGSDETAPGAGLEADEAATRRAEPDPASLEEADREAPSEAEGTSPKASATADDLEDELNRGAKVEPPAEREVREATDEATETVGGETAEMTDAPEELEASEAYGDAPESDSSAEEAVAERSGPDELDRSEGPGDAEARDVVDEPRGDEAFETDESAADVDSAAEDAASESGTARDAERGSEEPDLGDELDRGPNLESATESTDESPERPETKGMDLADELDRGADLDAIGGDASPETPDAGAGARPTEETNLTEEPDQGADVESAAETDRGEDVDHDDAPVGADAFPGPRADSEITADAAAPRSIEPASHAGLEAEPALEHRTDEPATAAADADETDRRRAERGGSESPVEAMFEAQKTAIERSQRLLEDGIAVQRDVTTIAMSALRGQLALQRQGLELVQSMTSDPGETAEATGAPAGEQQQQAGTSASTARSHSETGTLQRRSDASEPTGREFERRLELIDGLDSMYRERLEDAGIATLDDLAYADAETVAGAADVTEERAESWIEQAAA